MKSFLAFFVFMLFSLFGLAQKNEIKKLNTDLVYFKEALYQLHPSAFRYISKDSLDLLFASLAFTKDEKATDLELEKKMRLVLKKVKCIHTYVLKSIFKHNGKIIPFEVVFTNNKLWIKKDLADSLSGLEGSRILAINGVPTSEIITKIRNYRAADGNNQSFMNDYFNRWTSFSYLYQYYFDADSLKSYTLANKYNDSLVLERKNITSFKEEKIEIATGRNYDDKINLSFDTLNNLAILKIKSFSSLFPIIGRYINKSRYKRAIKTANKFGADKLVLDLRGNLGGDASAGTALLSFFVNRKHRYLVQKKKGPVFKYATTSSKIGHTLNYFFGDLFAGRWPTSKRGQSTVIVRKKKRNHFDGKIIVLVDGFTASTASNVAALLQHKTKAIVIGKETGGGENELNAYYPPVIKLPYSKIKFQIPLYYINLNLMEYSGHGVRPDIPITYGIEDILSAKDLEMEAVVKLTRK